MIAKASPVLLVALLVSACGQAPETRIDPEAEPEPSPTSSVRFVEEDCPGQVSQMINDYAADAFGDPDPLAAASAYAKEGDTVELTKQSGEVATAVVIDSHGVGTAEVGMLDIGHGWLVESVTKCA